MNYLHQIAFRSFVCAIGGAVYKLTLSLDDAKQRVRDEDSIISRYCGVSALAVILVAKS